MLCFGLLMLLLIHLWFFSAHSVSNSIHHQTGCDCLSFSSYFHYCWHYSSFLSSAPRYTSISPPPPPSCWYCTFFCYFSMMYEDFPSNPWEVYTHIPHPPSLSLLGTTSLPDCDANLRYRSPFSVTHSAKSQVTAKYRQCVAQLPIRNTNLTRCKVP